METIELIYGVLVACMLTLMMYLKIGKWIKARKDLMGKVRAMSERFDELQREIYRLEARLRCQEELRRR